MAPTEELPGLKLKFSHLIIAPNSVRIEHPEMNKSLPLFIMVKAQWCGHCVSALPAFIEATEKYTGVHFAIVEETTEEGKKIAEYLMKENPRGIKVAGYPTFLIYYDGCWGEYSFDRNKESFTKCLDLIAVKKDAKQLVKSCN